MRLTRYSDFAMRVMVYLAARDEGPCSVAEIAGAYGISQNHLMKVMNDLGRAGFITAARGRRGGFRLARPAETINMGALLRHTEEDFALVDCPNCRLGGCCALSAVLDEALAAFLGVFDRYTLADVMSRGEGFAAIIRALGLPQIPPDAPPEGQHRGACETPPAAVPTG
ncbi:RrF2 family transcriptional regulator [Ancylobacter sp. SL191]|uniref:RrF2 family transcriptional regulator n=1 Tax=Ancylobacter sp. SL191 TaxID=2995166 RepID=UPI002270DD27|nr:Rrf2 family transcriptional regulator [Ancylobacter sp. SL191]WAC25491.1 Rrf2 family transcriptional regulator [Ancylobacter sp. SL191]